MPLGSSCQLGLTHVLFYFYGKGNKISKRIRENCPWNFQIVNLATVKHNLLPCPGHLNSRFNGTKSEVWTVFAFKIWKAFLKLSHLQQFIYKHFLPCNIYFFLVYPLVLGTFEMFCRKFNFCQVDMYLTYKINKQTFFWFYF